MKSMKENKLNVVHSAITYVQDTWKANDGGLTMAAVDEVHWLQGIASSIIGANSSREIQELWASAIDDDEYRTLE